MQDKLNISETFESTRHKSISPDDFDPTKPRLGRRESEPHSDEINYLYDVLTTNFTKDGVMWDLHHYFSIDEFDMDLQFDISYFKDMEISQRLSSYKAKNFDNRIPTMAINVLSKTTWKTDIGETVDYCRKLKIPLYIVFPAYHVANKYYKPPFLRAYILQPTGEYHIEELRETTIDETNKNVNAVIDVSKIVPFRLGLKKRDSTHESNKALYRLILLDPNKFQVFLTKAEKEKHNAEEAQKRAEEAQKRAEGAEERAKKLETEVEDLRDQLKNRFS